ncbi:hypothetical protein FBQ96_02305, partial [Nitrospirales bacterium NOB]|nr:hypothetical protein [Nitrospirales bacterium NOB]
MTVLSRRRLLATAGVAAPWIFLRPRVGLAGLLENLFDRPELKATKPITPNDEFYVTSYRSPPTIRLPEWSLTIRSLVDQPLTLDYTGPLAKPTSSQIVTLECVGNTVAGEFMSTAYWEGVPLRTLMEEAIVGAGAYDVVFRAADGFSDSIRVERALTGDVLIAHRMNGVPLPQDHGFPARVIVPGHYGMKSVQWLTEIELVDRDYKGYYQQKGWTEPQIVIRFWIISVMLALAGLSTLKLR